MKMNSPPKSSPAMTPGQKVPSRPNSAMRRACAQTSTRPVAIVERIAACITKETSGAVSLIATCWKPHRPVSSTISETAVASSGRRVSIMSAGPAPRGRHAGRA